MKKVLALICALLMLLPLVTACGETEEAADTTASPAVGTDATEEVTVAETTPFDALEGNDYKGYTFKIRYPSVDNSYLDFYAEDLNGEAQNDAVFKRNNAVCDKLGIEIEVTWDPNTSVYATDEVMKDFKSGEENYNMYGGHRNSISLSYNGYLYDFRQNEKLSLDRVWWDQNWNESMTINDSLYFITGDISIDTTLYVSSLVFNKRLLSESGLEYPYELVREGKWTYDKLLEYTENYGQDVNNDGKMTPGDDIYSIIGWHYESGYSAFYGSGFKFMTRGADGTLGFDFDSDRLDDILTKVCKIWNTQHAYMRYTTGDSEHVGLYKIFADGQSMFADIVLIKIGWFFSDMTDDFGVVPIPKYTEDQENYCSYTGYTIPILCVNRNVENPERTGEIIEALARASYTMVIPEMYEIVVKSRNVRDADSAEMVEKVFRNKIFDAAHYYNLGTYGTLSHTQIQNNNAGLAANLKAATKAANTQWKTIQSSYDKLKG